MEGLRSADDWERWSRSKLWRELPRGQEQRHRRSDLVLFLGTGWTSFKYSWVHHDNLDAVPTWRMQFALFWGFYSVQLFFSLQPVPQTRYLANDGQAIVVRPTGNPAGTRVYEMKWQKHQSLQPVGWILHHRLARSMDRTQGDRSGGPEMCQIFLGDRERESDVNRYNQQVGLKDCVFGCPLEGLLSSGVSTIQSLV